MVGKTKKRSGKWFALLLVLICIVIAGGTLGVIAYLTDSEAGVNILSVGYNEIEIVEEFPTPEVTQGVNVYKKSVAVQNTGNTPTYVRVFLDFSDSRVADISEFSPDGTTFYAVSNYASHLPTGWVFVPETASDGALIGGFYYYTNVLEPGETTPKLIHTVKTTFADENDVVAFDIHVLAESVQTLDRDGQEFGGSSPWRSAWVEFAEDKQLS